MNENWIISIKLKIRPLYAFSFYYPHVPPSLFTFKQSELVEVVKLPLLVKLTKNQLTFSLGGKLIK